MFNWLHRSIENSKLTIIISTVSFQASGKSLLEVMTKSVAPNSRASFCEEISGEYREYGRLYLLVLAVREGDDSIRPKSAGELEREMPVR